MNPNIKKLWVEDLRANPGLQGRDRLHNHKTGKFCCLGRLCVLAVGAGVPIDVVKGINSVFYDGNNIVLPSSVMIWAGLDSANPRVEGATLSDHNDGPRGITTSKNFTEIADLIEKYL